MNRRLFWKILIIFWIIFYLTFQLTWIAFSYYIENKNQRFLNHMPTKVDMIAQLLHVAGEDETLNFIAHLPERERVLLSIKLVSPQNDQVNIITDELESTSYLYQRMAVAPDGTLYSVSFKDDKTDHSNNRKTLFNMPTPIVLMGICVGLVFSLFLAWNLTRPMKLLRQGFFRVSQGDLSVRLFKKLKPRRDELSELGKDFDMMVEQLNILISDRQALLHDVSHELRTPLARLQLAIGLAQQNKQNIDTSLARIELESERLDQLIGEILNYSRAEMNNRTDEYFDLKELIGVVVNDANYEANHQSIEVVFSISSISHSIVKGNSEQIRRAIENIIRNAIRFSKAGQTVEVSLKEAGKYLQIEVKDRGPGVDSSKLSSIFEPFVRIQSAQLGKGYGLGLAIARKTVIMHNGTIQANNRDGGGLVVTIKLPYWRKH
ncbi:MULTISPECIES: ATP-binding protein [unclassified Gilliamella]|uniref:ATP-binding protein n=1 Tax=unclassified Gilliamella TaxID=2685620 RepID=UPI00080E8653|nr:MULTISPECIES: ATP-binding protein [Gilliamella]MCX8581902.1 HAMP domain-containing protein [Gilliamella sp. B3482]MCX8583770.1 HAMP domain-containing protein [Gilliamella sp. B3372]MCX8586217.1 HAMP domain-containing protein [Gilliamella sp. B3562]MCX8595021.1 HAMP domain-containing protein [Gilliamella sp. B3367]MCX8597476.1 HAMP domain-containing protein [Gilliamella sp. B3493]